MHPTTPDGRYFVVKGRLWRCSNPVLPKDVQQHLIDQLMAARREVKQAKAAGDASHLTIARARVHTAKVALGERGPVWWDDGAVDLNRHLVANTTYADWYRDLRC
ncbi:hypothetical protein D3C76_1148050 [compost metagenome]